MKKRILSLFIAIIMILCFTSCVNSKKNDISSEEASESVSATSESTEIIQCTAHTDRDNDGSCDSCCDSVTIMIDFFAVNDLHGKFTANENQPGVDGMTYYLKNAVRQNKNTIIFSSGDMWQGSAEAGLTHGKIVTEWMNSLDFAFMTLGNHEFDWGDEYIKENTAVAEFPFLAINIYSAETNQLAEFCSPSVIVDLGDVQVGFIGAIGDCYSSISSERSNGYYFKVGDELTSLVKSCSEDLRSQGADIIVYSIHDGGYGSTSVSSISDGELSEYYDIALSKGYVDIVFEGHSHQAYINRDNSEVYHLQGSGDNMGISNAEMLYNTANGRKSVVSAEIIGKSVYADYKDGIVDELIKKYDSQIKDIYNTIGINDITRNSTELRNTLARLYYEAGEKLWGSKYDIVLGGGYLSCRSPSRLSSGKVGYGMLYNLFPFDNRLALCSCKGEDLLNNYINSDSYFNYFSDYGNSIKNKIDKQATYYIITDSYNYTYARNKLTVVEYYQDGIYARDLMAEYIRKGNMTSGEVYDLPEGDSCLTAEQVIRAGKKLPPNGETPSKYYYTGVVTKIENRIYGNMYIRDESGSEIYVYGLYGKNGVRFDSMKNRPKVGDEITVYGKIKRFTLLGGEQIEFYNAVMEE